MGGACLSKPQAAEGPSSPPALKPVAVPVREVSAPPAKAPAEVPAERDSPTSPLELNKTCFKPISEDARLQALLDCKCLDTKDERRFDSITSLLQTMFQVPIALVSLIDDDRLVFKSVAGTDCRQGNRLHSFCDASLRAPNPTMMIVPDTLEDPRFCNSQFVKGEPHVRMYAGAPLVSSEGHVLGSLGVMDIKPRTFPAGALNVICNFAELVVREMERDKAQLEAQQQKVETALNARRHMVRALSCFQEPVMLVNAGVEGWQILYCNENWCTTTGFSEPACLNSSFWDLFRPPASAGLDAKKVAQQAAADRESFSITVEGGHCAAMTLELKPATKDHLSTAVPTIGIPNFVEGLEPGELKVLDGYFFAVARSVQLVGGSQPGSTQPSAPSSSSGQGSERRAPRHISSDNVSVVSSGASSKVASLVHTDMRSAYSYARKGAPFGLEPPESLGDLTLGPLLGRGGYGRVHRGQWKSAAVAVKIIDTWVDPNVAEPTQPMLEALFSKNLTHPNIVPCFDFAFQIFESDADGSIASSGDLAYPSSQGSGSGNAPPPGHKPQQIWIVQQYCNHGTLGDAVDRGWLFKTKGTGGPMRPNLWAILPTAQEVAAAMRYLHSEGVIHGDLTPGNVLLTGARHTQRRDPRSFQAKVGDFGLASVAGSARAGSGTLGTMSHMPLELIEQELLTPAADVYAFGVLLWEMLSGKRAWAGLTSIQILTARSSNKERLEVPAGCPRGLRELVESCLSDDYTERPTFDDIVTRLDALLAEAEARSSAAPAPA